MLELLKLFWAFFKIGGLTFGGGYSMIPMLKKEFVEKNNWITEEELIDSYAISQVIPGVISVNIALIIGNKKRGILGGIFSMLGVLMPSFVIIILISSFIEKISEIEITKYVFSGIKIAILAMVLKSIQEIFKKSVYDKFSFGIFFTTFILGIIISPTYTIILCFLFIFIKNKFFGDEK